jgi:hypothetical protein
VIPHSVLAGYLLEELLASLIQSAGYRLLTHESQDRHELTTSRSGDLQVRGRGGVHQVDVLGEFTIVPAFSQPVRLFVEHSTDREPARIAHTCSLAICRAAREFRLAGRPATMRASGAGALTSAGRSVESIGIGSATSANWTGVTVRSRWPCAQDARSEIRDDLPEASVGLAIARPRQQSYVVVGGCWVRRMRWSSAVSPKSRSSPSRKRV